MNEAIHAVDCHRLLHGQHIQEGKHGETTWIGVRKHFHKQQHTETDEGVCIYVYSKVIWCAVFTSDKAKSFQHSPGQPSWRTAAPPSRRWSPCVCGSRLHRAWQSVCIAPELCPNPSRPEHLLDENRHIWEHNEDQCRHIKHYKQCPYFPSLVWVNLWVSWQKFTIIPRKCWRSRKHSPPPSVLIPLCPKPGVTVVREQAS